MQQQHIEDFELMFILNYKKKNHFYNALKSVPNNPKRKKIYTFEKNVLIFTIAYSVINRRKMNFVRGPISFIQAIGAM